MSLRLSLSATSARAPQSSTWIPAGRVSGHWWARRRWQPLFVRARSSPWDASTSPSSSQCRPFRSWAWARSSLTPRVTSLSWSCSRRRPCRSTDKMMSLLTSVAPIRGCRHGQNITELSYGRINSDFWSCSSFKIWLYLCLRNKALQLSFPLFLDILQYIKGLFQ